MGPGLELQGFKHGGPGGDPYDTGHGAVSTVAYHNGAVTKTAKYQYNTAGQLTKLLDWRRQACFPALGAIRHKVHSTQIGQWKKHLMDGAPQLFERGDSSAHPDEEKLSAPLFQEIWRYHSQCRHRTRAEGEARRRQ